MDLQHLPYNVRLMAVTKNHNIQEILLVLQKYNITLIGESRWQEAKEKLEQLPVGIEKHFIGHVQSNKIKEIMVNFDVIESVDSLKLAQSIDRVAKLINKIMVIFLQVNISHDPNKFGFKPEELDKVVVEVHKLNNISVQGLMAITAKQSSEQTRQDFKQLQQLQQFYHFEHLSMGMSDDWQIAVEEGATIIRVGRLLFL